MSTDLLSDRRPPKQLPQACHAAWHTAHAAHMGQYRSRDGRPYITHPETVAAVVQDWGLHHEVVNMALLHDVLEDSAVTSAELAARHGARVAQVVSALSKNKQLPKAEQGPEAKCRLALALPVLGPAAGVVKLVDRAHNMVTAAHLPHHKQAALVSDARYFFGPLAQQLGLKQLAEWFVACCPTQQGMTDAEFVRMMGAFQSSATSVALRIRG